MINKLIKLADYLDANGASQEAQEIDEVIHLLATDERFYKDVNITDEDGKQKASVNFTYTDEKGSTINKTEKFDNIDKALEVFNNTDMSTLKNEKKENDKKANFIVEKLISIADKLDEQNKIVQAEVVDRFLKNALEKPVNPYDYSMDYREEDPKSEQSKRYDSNYHHSLQIKEPAKKEERFKQKQYDTPSVQTYKPTGHALSTRYCPSHIGVSVKRIGENIYQCPLDGAIYNYEVGFKTQDGQEVPGGSVANQTPNTTKYVVPSRIFDSREPVINEKIT